MDDFVAIIFDALRDGGLNDPRALEQPERHLNTDQARRCRVGGARIPNRAGVARARRTISPGEGRAMSDIGEIDESKLDLMSSADCARGKLQRICLDLLREHRAQGDDGLPTNNRFLGYELMQRRIIKKQNEKGKRRGDQNMHEALMHLRETGAALAAGARKRGQGRRVARLARR